MTRYLSVLDVLGLHAFIMRRTGEEPALRNEGALESALLRPQMAAHYAEADFATQAALLMSGIALAHAFVDGNKRTAALAGDTFLQLNGMWIRAEPLALARQIEAIVNRPGPLGEATEQFAAWLRPQLESLRRTQP
jgi:death-on-curing protein